MKRIVSLIYCLALLAFSAQAAYACSCLEVKEGDTNYKAWLKTFDGAVFTGRVVKIEKQEDNHRLQVTFKIEKYWKGVRGAETVVYTALDSAACGVPYAEGETYFVAARKSDVGLQTDLCSHLQYTKDKKTMMRKLGRGKRPRTQNI